MFFISFLALYYAVLIPVQRSGRGPKTRPPSISGTIQPPSTPSERWQSFHSITFPEILLYIWIAGFAYDEFGEYRDAGQAFYATDFWSLWDLGTVAIGIAFFISRTIGLVKQSDDIIGISFDILSLEALFLVPRICSILSLNSYFGTLIPCLREMTKDFIKFLSLVVILYIGFLTTFTLLARDNFTAGEMTIILVKVFFGSSYLGFDVAQEISPVLGWPLMLVFVCMTNILLITSLISLLSTSLAKVLDHAREEYLFIYSVYVLEASTSNRLTYYLPPLNLLSLFMRPLRLIIAPGQLRKARIVLLKITHSPFVAAIWGYESIAESLTNTRGMKARSASSLKGPSATSLRAHQRNVSTSLQTARLPTRGAATASQEDLRLRPVANSREDLESLVLRLMAKVDHLSSQLASSQQQEADGADQGMEHS